MARLPSLRLTGIKLFVLTICAVLVFVSCKKDGQYLVNYADGHSYRIVYESQPWEKAKELCRVEGAKLAVPKNLNQFLFIQRLVRRMNFSMVTGSEQKEIVWVGVSDLDNTGWMNVDGEDIYNTNFYAWAGQYDRPYSEYNAKEPHCAGVDAVNPGLRDWWCSKQQPFICEKQHRA